MDFSRPEMLRATKIRYTLERLLTLKGAAILVVFLAIAIGGSIIVYRTYLRSSPIVQKLKGKFTTEDQLALYGDAARKRLCTKFDTAKVAYPPAKILMLGLKQEEKLEIYAKVAGSSNQDDAYVYVCSYPILAMSGGPGPKLKRGDNQVPEGFYTLTLEPNTPFHLALRLNYPSPFDLMHAAQDGRLSPGSDIMIHGNQCSAGCLAMGDPTSEDLFTLVADTGESNIDVVLVPHDFRADPKMDTPQGAPVWVKDLYAELSKKLGTLKKPAAATEQS